MHNAVKLANEVLRHNVSRHGIIYTPNVRTLNFTPILVPLMTPIISMDRKFFV